MEVVRKLISDAERANSQAGSNTVETQAVENIPEPDNMKAQNGAVASDHGSQADVAAEVADTAEKLDGDADT